MVAGILNKVSAIILERLVWMEFEFAYEVFSNNILFSVMAIVIILCGCVWLLKEFVKFILMLIKCMKDMDKDIE